MLAKDCTVGLTQERLKALLHYDPATGIFTWVGSKSRRVKNGSRADRPNDKGYRVLKIGERVFYCHRLAWLYTTGAWPTDRVDHINLDKGDCRWANLRAATFAENLRNRGPNKNAKSGLKGAYRKHDALRAKPWSSAIHVGGKVIHLGTFSTPEEANAAYREAAVKHFGQFARSAA